MVSFRRLLAAATACVLAVQAVPTQHGQPDSLQAGSVDTPDAIQPSSYLGKRGLRDMQVHWSDNGMITVLAGAYLSTQYLDAMSITHNLGVPGDQLWSSLRSSIWSYAGKIRGADRTKVIRMFTSLSLQKSVYWARTTFHSDFGFVMQLDPSNWNYNDIRLMRDFINEWASSAGCAVQEIFQQNDYARDTLNNPYTPRKRGLERRYACAAPYNIFEEQAAPMDAIPWSLYQSGDHCDLVKEPICPKFPTCQSLLKRSLVERALEMEGSLAMSAEASR